MCGGVVEQVEKAVVQPIGKGLSEVDTFVNREIPGGWVTVGLTAAGAAAYVAAADAAVAAGATLAEAEAAGAVAAASAEAAEAAAIAEGATTAGMAGAANTGLPAGTSTLGSFVGLDAATAAELGLSGGSALGTAGASGNPLSGIVGAESSFITPGRAIQGLRLGSSLLGAGGQQQQYPQLPQMGGAQQRMPQGAVDYSGIYNLLALQRAKNPNSLLG